MMFRKPEQFGKLLKYKLYLRCPSCNKVQAYVPQNKKIDSKKTKRCLFCGRTFNVRKNLIREADYGELVKKY